MNWNWKLQNKTVTNRGKIESSFNNESKCQGVCNARRFRLNSIAVLLTNFCQCMLEMHFTSALCILMAILYLKWIIWKRKTRFWSYANIYLWARNVYWMLTCIRHPGWGYDLVRTGSNFSPHSSDRNPAKKMKKSLVFKEIWTVQGSDSTKVGSC